MRIELAVAGGSRIIVTHVSIQHASRGRAALAVKRGESRLPS